MSENLYSKFREIRKKHQAEGLMPDWYSTAGVQMFFTKYLYEADSVKEQFQRIARTAAQYLKPIGKDVTAEEKFFEMLWKGWLSPSTPVLANMGTSRGLSVSCAGGFLGDSIYDFKSHDMEMALLTKQGFGTAGYLGSIRPRGSKISIGGTASGVLPVFESLQHTMTYVAQGTARRGAWAGYLEITHGDFYEMCDYILAHPDDTNVGWVIKKDFKESLKSGDKEANKRFARALYVKMITGKGYFFFHDNVNNQSPKMYKDRGLEVVTSQLCNEISLFCDIDNTFSCVLSSLNLAKRSEWKDTDTIFWATVFLDCVCEDFIQKGSKIKGLEKIIGFTKKNRALGLGTCGFHTMLQSMNIPFESLEAQFLNTEIFSEIKEKSLEASQWLAKELGEPEWLIGYGVRNSHRTAIAPTKSTSILIGNVSEGINPDPAMTFTQLTSAGEVERINGELVKLMKSRGIYTKKNIQEVIDADGSVQDVEWLSEHDKMVFKTAFEINQEVIIRLASQRQKYICQGQSLNLYLDANESEEWIGHLHKLAFEDKNLKGLYYIYSKSGIKASKECTACS